MQRLSTKGAMTRALEDLDITAKALEGLNDGINAALVQALPIAARPESSHDLDRGVWVRDDSGKLVWLRANT